MLIQAPIESYSKDELSKMYQVSATTMITWINKFKNKLPDYDGNEKIFTPKQVKIIFENLGEPMIEEKEANA